MILPGLLLYDACLRLPQRRHKRVKRFSFTAVQEMSSPRMRADL